MVRNQKFTAENYGLKIMVQNSRWAKSKIHVQKFTSKNSRSKNSRAGLGVFPLGRARGRAVFRGCVPLLLLMGAK